MKTLAALVSLVPMFVAPANALERCSPQDIKLDERRGAKYCDNLGFRLLPAPPPGLGVASWAKAMQQHEKLVAKAIEMGDIDELRRQSIELRTRSNDPSTWPDDDRWTLARVYCSTMATELANFVDDKLKVSARGEIAAEASMKAYRQAGPSCKRGLVKVK